MVFIFILSILSRKDESRDGYTLYIYKYTAARPHSKETYFVGIKTVSMTKVTPFEEITSAV